MKFGRTYLILNFHKHSLEEVNLKKKIDFDFESAQYYFLKEIERLDFLECARSSSIKVLNNNLLVSNGCDAVTVTKIECIHASQLHFKRPLPRDEIQFLIKFQKTLFVLNCFI